jgi:hypothetical protein
MTPESLALLGLVGLFFAYAGHFQHDRGYSGPSGWIVDVPDSLRPLLRHGPGPVRAVSVAFEVYGVGLLLLAILDLVAGGGRTPTFALTAWFVGGILTIGIVDTASEVQGWRERRTRSKG